MGERNISEHPDGAGEQPPRLEALPDLASPRGIYPRFLKPLADVVIGVVFTLLTAPLVLVIAIGIIFTMGRPVLFVHERVGRHGRTFKMYKFRTMIPDRRRQQTTHPGPERRQTHKTPTDPRVTRFGRFLRKWSLDEVPQLWNVALGQMSLVGPRPELLTIVESYEPWQHLRHVVKPGITGLWQISARGEIPMHEATEIDIQYVEQLSVWTDLRILLMTVPIALGLRRGF